MNDENHSEEISPLEKYLRAIPGEEISRALERRLANEFEPLSWRDRFVGGFMAISGVAALYILAVMLWQTQPSNHAPDRDVPAINSEMALQIKEMSELALLH